MKKAITLMLVLFCLQVANACDFCNCYLGLNPHYKKSIIGLRYHYMFYNGTHHDLSEFADADISKKDFWEKRTNVELHGQWYPVQKLQLIFSLPYIYNSEGMSAKGEEVMSGHHHSSDDGNQNPVHGIGDPIIIAHYQLFNKTNMDSSKFSHRLFIGGGIKFPLGKYKLGFDADPLARVHQPGSGSWDFIASAAYLGKINRAGFNINISYLYATVNSEHFRFGNRFNANATAYYQCNFKNVKLFPSVGAYYEKAQKDWNHNFYISNSGGTIMYAHAGLDFYYKNFSINTAFQLPVSQTLNKPLPEMNYRIITGISYAIK